MSKDTLKADERLEKYQSLTSKNKRFNLVLQDDENFVLYDRSPEGGGGDKAVWSSNTGEDSFITRGIMQVDGNFVLYDHNGQPKWSTGTNGKGDKSSVFQVADEGNIFIFSGGKEIWRARSQSVKPPLASSTPVPAPQPAQPVVSQPTVSQPASTAKPVAPSVNAPVNLPIVAPPVEVLAAVPTSTLTALRGGQSLVLKQSISSPNGKVSLVLQEDSNFCVYYKDGNNTKLLWTAHTENKGVTTARLRANGELVLFKADNTRIWASPATRTTPAKDAILLVQDDGHVVILAGGSRLWRSATPKIPGTDPDRLTADQYLESGQKLVSPNSKHKLEFQEDRNLCLYSEGVSGAVWAKVNEDRTERPGRVWMRDDDDLWYGEGGNRGWTSTTRRRAGGGDGMLMITDVGAAVIKSDGLTIWSSDEKKVAVDAWEPETIPVAPKSNKLKPGEHLRVTDNIVSKNGQFQAWLAEQGNLTVYRRVGNGEWHFLYSSKTSANWVSKVALAWTGELIVYGANAKRLWVQGSANSDGSVELTMQDDGNLVLTRDGNSMWSTDTNFPASIKPTDKLRQGEYLAIDQVLTSANGQFTLALQPNANFLISRKSDSAKIFTSSAKNVTGAQFMCFDRESNDLVVYNKDGKQTQRDGKVLWKAGNTKTFGWTKSEFVMQDDGNAVFYMQGDVVWSARDNLAQGSVMFTPLPNATPQPVPVTPSPAPKGNIPSDWAKGGDGTNRLLPGQTLRYGQSLFSDPTRKFTCTIDLQGQLVIKSNTTPPKNIWGSGTDTAVAKTAYLQVTTRGQLVIRGVMNPSEGGEGLGEITLWTGGVYLKLEGRDLFFIIEEDGAPAIYNWGKDVVWRPQDWKKAS